MYGTLMLLDVTENLLNIASRITYTTALVTVVTICIVQLGTLFQDAIIYIFLRK